MKETSVKFTIEYEIGFDANFENGSIRDVHRDREQFFLLFVENNIYESWIINDMNMEGKETFKSSNSAMKRKCVINMQILC